MNIEYDQFEIIEAYINRELSVADHEHFEKQIAANPDLDKAVEEHKSMRIGLRAIAIERQLKSISKKYNEPKTTILPIFWTRVASVILFIGVGLWAGISYQKYRQSDKLFEDNYTIDDGGFAYKGLSSSSNESEAKELLEAIKSFKDNNYSKAVTSLNRIPDKGSNFHYKKYYLGLSYLAKAKTAPAIENLKIASKTDENLLKYKAEWYLALAYLKSGDKQNTLSVLKNLVNSDNAYQKKAIGLQEKLRN